MARVYNFNAGPAGLPLAALERMQRELIDFEGTGMSILEHSHRGKAYEAVHDEAISHLRTLLTIPDDYDVLFLQGGASQQFAVIPMNLLPPGKSADYVITGGWSEKAYEEACRIGKARVAATTVVDKQYRRIPKESELELDPDAAYVVYCRSGNRSAQAASVMAGAGLDVVDGGAMTDMVEAGWPAA